MNSPLGRRTVLGAAGTAVLGAVTAGEAVAASGPHHPHGGSSARIDVHCHHVPDFYRASVDAHGGDSAGGELPDWSPEAAVSFMDAFGIAAQVVSISTPGCAHLTSRDERVALAREVNDWTREHLVATTEPGLARRFGAFALLPLGLDPDEADVAAACAEAKRAVRTLGLDGIGLLSSYGGTYLGDDVLDPLLATIEKLGVLAIVHPATPATMPGVGAADGKGAGLPPLLLEFTFDTTRAAVNMSYALTYLKFPRLRLQLSHAGGALPFLKWRAALGTFKAPIPEKAFDYSRLYYDTALSWGPESMETTTMITSSSHVMFGSDWPFTADVWDQDGDKAAELGQSFRGRHLEGVLRTNALRQLPRLKARLSGGTA